jgi:hypothetical protein
MAELFRFWAKQLSSGHWNGAAFFIHVKLNDTQRECIQRFIFNNVLENYVEHMAQVFIGNRNLADPLTISIEDDEPAVVVADD